MTDQLILDGVVFDGVDEGVHRDVAEEQEHCEVVERIGCLNTACLHVKYEAI